MIFPEFMYKKIRKRQEKKDIKNATTIKYKFETPYDSLFEKSIITRGTTYFLENKIETYEYSDNTLNTRVSGSDKYSIYRVHIEFKNNKIKESSCTCPYYNKEEKLCKHIYTSLLSYCDTEKIEGYTKEEEQILNKFYLNNKKVLFELCDKMYELIEKTKKLRKALDSYFVRGFYRIIFSNYKRKLRKFCRTKPQNVTLDTISRAIKLSKELSSDVKKLMEDYKNNIAKYGNKTILEPRIDTINSTNKEEDIQDFWNLTDEEYEQVKEGNYDPWSFEEEELEEDDYYSEDDEESDE